MGIDLPSNQEIKNQMLKEGVSLPNKRLCAEDFLPEGGDLYKFLCHTCQNVKEIKKSLVNDGVSHENQRENLITLLRIFSYVESNYSDTPPAFDNFS